MSEKSDIDGAAFGIAELRAEKRWSQQRIGEEIGCFSRGRMSEIEAGKRRPTVSQAIAIEYLSRGADGVARIDAAALNDDVAAARARCECPLVHGDPNKPAAPGPSTGQNREMSRDHGEAAI